MQTVIIPHRDSSKHGATEHVDAIINALQARGDYVILSPVSTINFSERMEAIRAKYGDKTQYLVVTGDYGAEEARRFKAKLGHHTKVLMSSYTAAQEDIIKSLRHGSIDYLAVPAHAIAPGVLPKKDAQVIERNRGRLIPMTAVPHLLTSESLATKRTEWDKAAVEGKVQPLPQPDASKDFVSIVIPGDVEDEQGKPKFFTEEHARKLAAAIVKHVHATDNTVLMVTNGPRTSKYDPGFPDELKINDKRLNSIDDNPVTRAFIDELTKSGIDAQNIIRGCIEKGKTPAQGFLAFYDVLNQQANAGGKATLFIDGVSTTMLAQATNVLGEGVEVIACDTPARNQTHVAAVSDLTSHHHINSKLALHADGHYSMNTKTLRAVESVDDAAIIADKIAELVQGKPKSITARARDRARTITGKFTSLVGGNANAEQPSR